MRTICLPCYEGRHEDCGACIAGHDEDYDECTCLDEYYDEKEADNAACDGL